MSPADLKVHLSTIGITGERESMMIKIEAGKARKTLAALLATVLVGAGLGPLGYSILGGGSPASADDPGRVHGRISEELEAKFNRSIPQRIVAGIRGDDRPRLKTPESKQLRLTYPGTKSNLVFWDLNKLQKGDEILLTDSEGTRYTYKVFEKQIISPSEVGILRPVKGKNIVSLQTCTLPDYSHRLIVRGELVERQ